MAQQQQSQPARPIIPFVACPRCQTAMRLTMMEPAVMSASSTDTLVFGCYCGFTYKQPMQPGL